MARMRIPFSRPCVSGRESEYLKEALANGHLSGDGPFTKKCQAWLEERTGCKKALLTPSCTAALEMAALLAGIGPGDEVIMPSFTFSSTANAFVLRGGVPVFIDIREDTLNMDEKKIEAALTGKTRAIVPVHYAGVGCEMDAIMEIAERHKLLVIEDAAQGVMADYRGRPLGAIGHLGAFSFHETKNLISGEGGALLVNDPEFAARVEILREKGTNRSSFFRGEVDKYTWVDVGSSYLPGEMSAAYLLAQLENSQGITARRKAVWSKYHSAFAALEKEGLARRPVVPPGCEHNAHIYYLIVADLETRSALIAHLKAKGIGAVFHYVPLHSSPAGRRYCRAHGDLRLTDGLSDRLVRLPLWPEMEPEVGEVVEEVTAFLGGK